jgi:predicted ATP-dependent serine protease
MDEVRPCGHTSSTGAGTCPECDVINTIVSELMHAAPIRTNREIAEVALAALAKVATCEPEKLAAALRLNRRARPAPRSGRPQTGP